MSRNMPRPSSQDTRSDEGAQRDFGSHLSRGRKPNTTAKFAAVTAIASSGKPAPQAMPTAAVTQRREEKSPP